MIPRLFGNSVAGHTTRAHRHANVPGGKGRVRTGDRRHPVVRLCQLGQDTPSVSPPPPSAPSPPSLVAAVSLTGTRVGAHPIGTRAGRPTPCQIPTYPGISQYKYPGQANALSRHPHGLTARSCAAWLRPGTLICSCRVESHLFAWCKGRAAAQALPHVGRPVTPKLRRARASECVY